MEAWLENLIAVLNTTFSNSAMSHVGKLACGPQGSVGVVFRVSAEPIPAFISLGFFMHLIQKNELTEEEKDFIDGLLVLFERLGHNGETGVADSTFQFPEHLQSLLDAKAQSLEATSEYEGVLADVEKSDKDAESDSRVDIASEDVTETEEELTIAETGFKNRVTHAKRKLHIANELSNILNIIGRITHGKQHEFSDPIIELRNNIEQAVIELNVVIATGEEWVNRINKSERGFSLPFVSVIIGFFVAMSGAIFPAFFHKAKQSDTPIGGATTSTPIQTSPSEPVSAHVAPSKAAVPSTPPAQTPIPTPSPAPAVTPKPTVAPGVTSAVVNPEATHICQTVSGLNPNLLGNLVSKDIVTLAAQLQSDCASGLDSALIKSKLDSYQQFVNWDKSSLVTFVSNPTPDSFRTLCNNAGNVKTPFASTKVALSPDRTSTGLVSVPYTLFDIMMCKDFNEASSTMMAVTPGLLQWDFDSTDSDELRTKIINYNDTLKKLNLLEDGDVVAIKNTIAPFIDQSTKHLITVKQGELKTTKQGVIINQTVSFDVYNPVKWAKEVMSNPAEAMVGTGGFDPQTGFTPLVMHTPPDTIISTFQVLVKSSK